MSKSFQLPQIILESCFLYYFAYLAEHRRYSLRGNLAVPNTFLSCRGLEYTLIIWCDKVKPSGSYPSVNRRKKIKEELMQCNPGP